MRLYTLLLCALSAVAAASANPDTQPIDCRQCDAWNAPQAPFQIHGNTWYVGPKGLSSLLVVTDDGLVLFDGALPQSAELIAGNIRELGFAVEDLRWILNSHAHFDHAGGIAALQRISGARVAASPRSAEVLRQGQVSADDPQAGLGARMAFPPVAEVQVLADGERIELGGVQFTVHFTPGHTPGGSSWSWRSCDKDDCVDLVYADSLTAVSAPDFRFTADVAAVERFRASIARVAALPCEILVSSHPEFSRLFERQEAADGFVDREACRDYATRSARALDRRLADE